MAIAIGLWTGLVLVVLLFGGWDLRNAPHCNRVINPSLACVAQVDAFNDALQRFRYMPIYAAIVSGYVAILVIRAVGWSRERRRRG